MKKVENEKVEVPQTKDMNDSDILNDVLTSEKNMSNNYSYAIDEMSNKVLYKKIMKIFEDTKNMARESFELSFKKGWYTLEKADENKITQAYDKANQQINELS
jgi:spore coat protein CotF